MSCLHDLTSSQINVPDYCLSCASFLLSSDNAVLREQDRAYRPDVSPFEVLAAMRNNSKFNRHLNHNQEYITHRTAVVDWLFERGEALKLSTLTLHSAVHYLDTVLNVKEFNRGYFEPLALICLMAAAKSEELDSKVPRFKQISSLTPCSVATLRRMELDVLHNLNWKLIVNTTMHFLQFYLTHGVIFKADRVEARPASEREVRYVRKYSEFFADLCIQGNWYVEYRFLKYDSETLALACIAAARRAVRITPVWSPALNEISNLDLNIECYEDIYSYYQEVFASSESKKSTNKKSKHSDKSYSVGDKENCRNSVRSVTVV